MKTMRIVTVVCWVVAALALIGLATWFLVGNVLGINRGGLLNGITIGFNSETLAGPFEVVAEYSVPGGGIDSLQIDWVAGEITISPYDGDEFQIREMAQRELRDDENLQISTSGATLTIKYSERSISNMPIKRLEVLVPSTFSANADTLRVDSSSASISVSEINAGSVRADSVSGAVQLSEINARALTSRTTSGSITIASTSADDMSLGSISGAIRTSEIAAKTLKCSTTSGSINLSGSFDQSDIESISGRIMVDNTTPNATAKASTTSGAIEFSGSFASVNLGSTAGRISISSEVVPADLKISTTSGSVTVTVPDGESIYVNHSSVSGRFSSDVPVIMQNNGAQFRISTVSGSVTINKYN